MITKYTLAFLSVYLSAGIILASQQEPTKAELLATVRHIAEIAKQQQADLDSVKQNLSDAQTVEIPKLKQEISDQATALAQAQARNAALEKSRHGWVKRFWIVSGLLVAAGVWILRKPIMMAAGGFL